MSSSNIDRLNTGNVNLPKVKYNLDIENAICEKIAQKLLSNQFELCGVHAFIDIKKNELTYEEFEYLRYSDAREEHLTSRFSTVTNNSKIITHIKYDTNFMDKIIITFLSFTLIGFLPAMHYGERRSFLRIVVKEQS